jgi:2-iminobutanoate/2-iminopropanoate deaminase
MPPARTVAGVLLLTLGLAATAGAQQGRRYIDPRTAADKGQPPFSQAVEIGNTLYLSGEIGLDSNQRVPDRAEGEARLLLDRVQATLKKAGYTMDDLVFVQIFCSDVKHYDAFNAVYRGYFKREFPARAFIGSGTLLFNARFELQGIAVKR